MLDEVVERRGWIDREHFLHLIGVTNLLPGPNSSQVAIHVGHTQRGVPGALLTGLAFLGPTFLIVTALSVVYFRYGTLPAVEPVLWGLKPVIAAIILMAGWRLGRVAVRGKVGVALGALGLVAALLAGRWIVTAMGLGGVLTWWIWRSRSGGAESRRQPDHGESGPTPRSSTAMTVVPASLLGLAVSAGPLLEVFGLHLGLGAFLFGGGYALVALLQPFAVEAHGWLSPAAYLDGIAITQAVPGPISTLSAFVGYAAAGVPGAVVATAGVYLPAFLAVLVAAPYVERLRRAESARAALEGVNAVVTGSILGVGLALLPAAVVDVLAGSLFMVALVGMAWLRVPAAAVVAGGLLAGLARLAVA
jgi:chromate transporter